MVQGRSVAAGVLGIVCAFAVLAFMGLSQAGLALSPSMSPGAALVSSTQAQSNQSTFTGPSSNIYGAELPRAQSSQSIESPSAIFGAVLLGAISLVVGLGAAFVVSRKAG